MFTQMYRVADPYPQLSSLHRHLDTLLSDWVRPRARATAGPALDVLERGDQFVVLAEVPGMKAEDLEIEVTEDGLSLRGERKVSAPEGFSVHRRERESFRVARSFTFPAKIDPEKVEAVLDAGVLRITLTKRADAKPRAITVRSVA